jgi:riboflavin biosynthesis pyrimidine reductase
MRRLYPDSVDDVDVPAAYPHAPGIVRANMVASADGAATVEGRSGGLSSTGDHQLFLTLRTLSDVVLVGASTVRKENYGPARPSPAVQERRQAEGLAAIPPIAVVTASLDLDPTARFFAEAVVRPIIITTDDADTTRLQALSEVADVVSAGSGRVDMGTAIDLLAERGLTRVLSEGGPALLGELVAAGRLDELALTVAPVVTGGHAKRITDGPPVDPPTTMRLVHVLEEDESLFLLYRAAGSAQ